MKKSVLIILLTIVTFSSQAQSKLDTIYYNNYFNICNSDRAYFYKLMKFDENSESEGQITDLISNDEYLKRKALKIALSEGRFVLTKIDGITTIKLTYVGIDEEYNEESYGKITSEEIIKNNKKIASTYYTYYSNKNLKLKYTKDGASNRIAYAEYQPNGTLEMEYTVTNGIKNTKTYTKSGVLKSNINQDKKQNKIGECKTYFNNGKINKIENYSNGKLNGTYKMFYENGQLKVSSNYKDGQKNGEFISYHENGQLMVSANYRDGQPDGKFKSFYENGTLNMSGSFTNGEQTITQGPFDENGQLIKN
ncbi:toxin-antitoxin system YwqK family antitoxin [Lutibacter holmesii]|uniref:Toxin-antitoxin system YwqK family antitoxin n=1 Tax=Lutibacter holmesii TaxID=1137985 RepID=A0ABW3WRP7_9FLAO